MYEPISRFGEDVVNGLGSILEQNRLNNFRGRLDKEGFYLYKDSNGQFRRVLNKDHSQALVQMRGIMDSILDERVNVDLAHRSTQELLRSVGLGVRPSISQIDSIVNNVNLKIDEPTRASLKALSSYLTHMADLKRRDYIPFTRNGDYGISVKGSSGKIKAFVTFDMDKNGKPINDGNWKAAQETLAKYEGMKISEPFQLTKDQLLNKLTNKDMAVDIIDQLIDIMHKSGTKVGKNT